MTTQIQTRRTLTRKLFLQALSSTSEHEAFTALQKAKDMMSRAGHDIHAIADHMEGIGLQVIPVGYASPEEVDRVREEAIQEGFQRGRETERLSEGRSATNWNEVALECRDHRILHPGSEMQFVNDMVERSRFDFFEPSPKQRQWLQRIPSRTRV
jgi:hypothetical protein